jgi:cell division protein YceG involved in septum cleavage
VARGDRSRPTHERTAEERERDREERARRRGELPAEEPPPPPPSPPGEPVEIDPPVEPAVAVEPHVDIEPSVDVEPPVVEPAVNVEPPAAFEPPPVVGFPIDTEPDVEVDLPAEEPVEIAALASPIEEPFPIEPVEPPVEEPVESPPPPARRAPTIELPPPLRPELIGSPAPRDPRRRVPLARIGALVALLVVIAAVVVLLVALLRPEKTKTIAAPVVVKVLVPEGKTRAQIAEIAAADHMSGSYTTASKRSSLLNPRHYGAPHGTTSLEGFLFPATYDMNKGAPAERLVEAQLTAFRENFTESQVARARDLHVTPYELLTVASMVEREAQIPGDRAKIAAVIYNRLHEGIPLGIDATIYYAVEQQKHVATYTRELTEAQLRIDSPYNTRTHTGLPPTPISNPGNASIHAAAYPAHVSYLYYVAGADGCGEQVFSDTQSAFETNVAAYHAAVSGNGGKPPTCKKK